MGFCCCCFLRFRLSERTDEFVFLPLFFFTLFFFWSGGGWREKQRKGKGLKMDAFDKPAL